MVLTYAIEESSVVVSCGQDSLSLPRRGKKCAFGAVTTQTKYKAACEEASEGQKVTLGSHRDTFSLHEITRSLVGQHSV